MRKSDLMFILVNPNGEDWWVFEGVEIRAIPTSRLAELNDGAVELSEVPRVEGVELRLRLEVRTDFPLTPDYVDVDVSDEP